MNPTIQRMLNSNSGNIIATGGTITFADGYKIHTFTSSGVFQIVFGSGAVEYLIVGGGGSGGGWDSSTTHGGAGGGAGGFLTGSVSVSEGSVSVTVGTGGEGVSGYVQGNNGADSSFGDITSLGGGGGGRYGSSGNSGGSGGGGGGNSGNAGSGTVGQGNDGGVGLVSTTGSLRSSGGGGGAGSAGENGQGSGIGGDGGVGVQSSITGAAIYYAGGGGGRGFNGGGSGGSGGGGNASGSSGSGAAGVANTGGGGGGGRSGGGAGGSGIVVIRYRAPTLPPEGFKPTDLSNCVLWLDASDADTILDSSGSVYQWDDKSGSGNNVTQGTSEKQPITGVRTINNLNALDFNSSRNFSLPSSLYNVPSGDSSLFCVFQLDETSEDQRPFVGSNMSNQTRYGLVINQIPNTFQVVNSGGSFVTASISITENTFSHIGGLIRSGSTITALYDDLTATGTASNFTMNTGSISTGNSALSLNGTISEIILYTDAKNSSDKNKVMNYLKNKWETS